MIKEFWHYACIGCVAMILAELVRQVVAVRSSNRPDVRAERSIPTGGKVPVFVRLLLTFLVLLSGAGITYAAVYMGNKRSLAQVGVGLSSKTLLVIGSVGDYMFVLAGSVLVSLLFVLAFAGRPHVKLWICRMQRLWLRPVIVIVPAIIAVVLGEIGVFDLNVHRVLAAPYYPQFTLLTSSPSLEAALSSCKAGGPAVFLTSKEIIDSVLSSTGAGQPRFLFAVSTNKELSSLDFVDNVSIAVRVCLNERRFAPDSLVASGDSRLALSRQLREEVYAALGISRNANSKYSLDLGTQNPAAYDCHLSGLVAINEYSQIGFTTAIGEFKKAMRLDSTFVAPYLRVANTYNLLADRRWQPDHYLDYLDSVQSYAEAAIRIDSGVVRHPLYLKIRGDYCYLMGVLHFRQYLTQTDGGEGRAFDLSLLSVSRQEYEKAADFLVAAIDASPSSFKLKFNLASAYYELSKVHLRLGELDSAKRYASLAERAIEESSDLFAFDGGPFVFKSRILLLKSRLEPRGKDDDIRSAEHIVQQALGQNDYRPLRDLWSAWAWYALAAIQCDKGEIDSAIESLRRSCAFDAFNVPDQALGDPDFRPLWDRIELEMEGPTATDRSKQFRAS